MKILIFLFFISIFYIFKIIVNIGKSIIEIAKNKYKTVNCANKTISSTKTIKIDRSICNNAWQTYIVNLFNYLAKEVENQKESLSYITNTDDKAIFSFLILIECVFIEIERIEPYKYRFGCSLVNIAELSQIAFELLGTIYRAYNYDCCGAVENIAYLYYKRRQLYIESRVNTISMFNLNDNNIELMQKLNTPESIEELNKLETTIIKDKQNIAIKFAEENFKIYKEKGNININLDLPNKTISFILDTLELTKKSNTLHDLLEQAIIFV